MNKTIIKLCPEMFLEREQLLVQSATLKATSFRWPSGVAGLRLENEFSKLEMLPFQGQQIWSAELGLEAKNLRKITMKSMFETPQKTQTYLENYGGFLLHCGFSAMGVPGEQDSHPLHGELPNALYQSASLTLSEENGIQSIALSGQYQHTVAFNYNYIAEPTVTLSTGARHFDISFRAKNIKKTAMEYMYMAHVNFRPVTNGRLVYSAPCDSEHVKMRESIPSHINPTPEYLDSMQLIKNSPEKHHLLSSDMVFDPEIVFNINYLADNDGWAHSMQVHPDGSADYIKHQIAQLPVGVRCICRTPDQDALGLVLPATAGPEGFTREKEKGFVPSLPAGEEFHCNMQVGLLSRSEANSMEEKISELIA